MALLTAEAFHHGRLNGCGLYDQTETLATWNAMIPGIAKGLKEALGEPDLDLDTLSDIDMGWFNFIVGNLLWWFIIVPGQDDDDLAERIREQYHFARKLLKRTNVGYQFLQG